MGIAVSKVNVNLDARLEPDGSVRCRLECDGQEAIVTFTGTDVLFDVPEHGRIKHATEGIEVEPDPADVGAPVQ
jgi:hypothetical protein